MRRLPWISLLSVLACLAPVHRVRRTRTWRDLRCPASVRGVHYVTFADDCVAVTGATRADCTSRKSGMANRRARKRTCA